MPASATIVIEKNVPVAMRDGTTLYADVYRPAEGGPWPVLLQRTPYNKSFTGTTLQMLDVPRAALAGYAVVVQDCRGRFTSDGEFYVFRDETDDGYDTVEWAAEQPWSNGRVGMYGASYVGATQWLAALSRPPHLEVICPLVTASDYHEGWAYQGGAFELGFAESWITGGLALPNFGRLARSKGLGGAERTALVQTVDGMCDAFRHLPVRDFPVLSRPGLADYFRDWVDHPDDDAYWQRWAIERHYQELDLPALHIGGWYDIFLLGTLRNYTGMRSKAPTERARRGQKLIVGPWHHAVPFPNLVGQHNFGILTSALGIDLDGIQLRWFDHWLKDQANGMLDEPPVRIFVMGENVWRDEAEWPLARTHYVNYYLHGGGRANSRRGDGSLSPEPPAAGEPFDAFLYDPRDPVPTQGGGLCCSPTAVPGGAFDQGAIEDRSDVLVYSTPPLDRPVEVTGPIEVTLFAASSAPDTDWTGKLVDVSPDGHARNLIDGIIRAHYRESKSDPTPIEPGRVYRYTIDLVATSNLFLAGHQIRLEISSSNFPRFDRNPNTGAPFGRDDRLEVAMQRVFHDADRPSALRLPIIPR